jgi:hypothetical protein
VRRGRGTEESGRYIFIKKFPESFKLDRGKGVYGAKGWSSAIFQIDFQIVGTMWRKLAGFPFIEDIRKLMVFRRYSG